MKYRVWSEKSKYIKTQFLKPMGTIDYISRIDILLTTQMLFICFITI